MFPGGAIPVVFKTIASLKLKQDFVASNRSKGAHDSFGGLMPDHCPWFAFNPSSTSRRIEKIRCAEADQCEEITGFNGGCPKIIRRSSKISVTWRRRPCISRPAKRSLTSRE